jgi:hypothetical protein
MATSLAKATELGFAEFASTLISETLNAIVTSILNQEKQAAQLEQQAVLSPEEYANENLTNVIVRAEVIRLFPSSTGNADKSAVDAGEPYVSAKETEESPAILRKLDYKIVKGDIASSSGKQLITSSGYAHILAATRLALAEQHLSVLKVVIARGIPRVYVDNGHISSKLTLRFEADTSAPASLATTGSRIAGAGFRKIIAQPVSANRPEYLSLNADILSEVEITFKTVVP